MLFVFMKEVQHLDIFGLMFIIQIDKNGIDIMIMKVNIIIRNISYKNNISSNGKPMERCIRSWYWW